MTIILGIDPGSRKTGYGVVHIEGSRLSRIASGWVDLSSGELSQRLGKINTEISQIIKTYVPTEVAIERVFVHHNVSSALKLGQARGAAIVSASQYDLPVAEYSARQVKLAVVGYGAAIKDQVQIMVRNLLGLKSPLQEDEADALAIAICHAHSRGSLGYTR